MSDDFDPSAIDLAAAFAEGGTDGGAGPSSTDGGAGPSSTDGGAGPSSTDGGAGEPEIDPAQAEAMAKELSDARERLLEASVADVVVNHAIGLYELAAIHLTAEKPNFDETRLAIDSLKALVENLKGRLGEGEAMLTEALSSLQMGFVQRLAESEGN